MAGSIYAVVHDVPASWSTYLEGFGSLGDRPPDGLLVHVAGPTEEGFRVIDVWESQTAWERTRDDRLPGVRDRSAWALELHTTVRDLMVQRLFLA